jgi:hypothetical protein
METGPVEPAVTSLGKVHGEVDMSTQSLKTSVVEPPDGSHVASYRPDRQVLMAASDSFGNCPLDEKSPNASATEAISYDHWFDLSAGSPIEESRKPGNPTIEFGYPGRHSFSEREIIIKGTPGIAAADRRVLVYTSMMLSQLDPQHPRGRVVSRRVVTDDNAGLGW